jgi:hypothetical protein
VTPLRAALALSVVSCALLAAPRAHAQPPANADAIIEHGIQLREQGHDDQALIEFRRAYAVSPSPRARAQMGLAEQALGQWVLAEKHLREALEAEADPWISGRRVILMNAASAVAHHLGSLAVTGMARGSARVFLDGVDVGPLPLVTPVRVETGSRLLEVRAQGFYPVIRTIEVTSGSTARETVNLVPSDHAEAAAEGKAPALAPRTPQADEGTQVPGAFHASFLPGGPPVGVWTLRDAKDAVLCTLPCAYWVDPQKKYTLSRSSIVKDEHEVRIDLPPTLFREGAEVREQIRAPSGSFVGGVVLTAASAAALVAGVVLVTTSPSDSPLNPNAATGYLEDELGVTAIIAGTLGVTGGIVMMVLSQDWRVDARANMTSALSLHLSARGVELGAGTARAWLTPFGVRGVF